MSTLANESLYETCFDESFEEYMRISGLSSADLDKWIKVNPFVLDWIENMAWKKFQSMSSWRYATAVGLMILTSITTGTHHWKSVMRGVIISQMLTLCVKSVLI